MNRQQIDLVRATFALVQPIAPQAAALFYDKLFVADPTLRALFSGSMSHQGERLMTMIGAAVGMLDDTKTLLPVLRQLGARHARYGVCDRHYAVVGSTLLATLGDGLGDAFTPPARDAWTALYVVVSTTMQAGACEVAVA